MSARQSGTLANKSLHFNLQYQRYLADNNIAEHGLETVIDFVRYQKKADDQAEQARKRHGFVREVGKGVGKLAAIAGFGIVAGLSLNSIGAVPDVVEAETGTLVLETRANELGEPGVDPLLAAEIGVAFSAAFYGLIKIAEGIAD